MNQLITDFVHDALARGVSREDISRALQKGGWALKEISAALDAFVESDLPLPVPRKSVSSSPKEAFFFLMLFSTLFTAAFALGSVLFDLINLLLPEPGETALYTIMSLRYGIASVVVAFPFFLFMDRVIARENVRNPGQRISSIRRWLTYLTLFVASAAIASDLIALIMRFLEGDVTLRFNLKVLVVAILAGGAFAFYLRDLHRDEVAPPTEFGLTRSARLGVACLIAAVVVVIGIGFWFAGSPMRARLIAQDRQRIRDLASICKRVENYYSNKASLPASLEACDINPGTFIDQKTDRITGQPYEYHIKDATHFEIGAAFALPSDKTAGREIAVKGSIPGEESGFWSHGPGRKTFSVDVTRVKWLPND